MPIALFGIKLIVASSWNTVNVMVSVKRVITLSGPKSNRQIKIHQLEFTTNPPNLIHAKYSSYTVNAGIV